MHHLTPKRKWKSGIVAGLSAFITLKAMLLNIGGIDGFRSMILTISPLFILISIITGLIGFFLSNWHLRWIALIGIGIGLLSGFAIIAHAVSNI